VDFERAPANRGTLVKAVIRYRPPAGVIGRVVSRFLGKVPNFIMRQDLRRLEAILETGEIPTTDGQPHGPRDAMTAAFRAVDPTRPLRPESKLTDVLRAQRRVS
jgi:hypothetical protein